MYKLTKVNNITKTEDIEFESKIKKDVNKYVKQLLVNNVIMIVGYEYCATNDKSIEYRLNY